jgi:hypothetical protein
MGGTTHDTKKYDTNTARHDDGSCVDHDLGTHYEHEHDMRRTTHLNTMVAHLNTMMAHPNPDFFVLTFFKIIYKINLWKTFFFTR